MSSTQFKSLTLFALGAVICFVLGNLAKRAGGDDEIVYGSQGELFPSEVDQVNSLMPDPVEKEFQSPYETGKVVATPDNWHYFLIDTDPLDDTSLSEDIIDALELTDTETSSLNNLLNRLHEEVKEWLTDNIVEVESAHPLETSTSFEVPAMPVHMRSELLNKFDSAGGSVIDESRWRLLKVKLDSALVESPYFNDFWRERQRFTLYQPNEGRRTVMLIKHTFDQTINAWHWSWEQSYEGVPEPFGGILETE